MRGTGEALGVPDQVRFSLTARGAAVDLLGKVPIRAGQQQIRVNVTIAWAFA